MSQKIPSEIAKGGIAFKWKHFLNHLPIESIPVATNIDGFVF